MRTIARGEETDVRDGIALLYNTFIYFLLEGEFAKSGLAKILYNDDQCIMYISSRLLQYNA